MKNKRFVRHFYLQNRPTKTDSEIQSNIDWCLKTLNRVKGSDCEGVFRWYWVLVDNLEIFCDIMKQPYWGPKNTLRWMQEVYQLAFENYSKSLRQFNIESLEEWILYIKNAW